MKTLPQPLIIPIASLDWWDGMLRQRYRVVADYEYCWSAEGTLWQIRVSEGTEFDGASVPRVLWWIVPPDGLHRPAALIHDMLYRYRGALPGGMFHRWNGRAWVAVKARWERKQADKLFARILREAAVGKVRRRLMYLGVRLGGWLPWYKRVAKVDG